MNKSTKLLLLGLATGATFYLYKEVVKNKKSENKEDNTDKYEYYKAFSGDVSPTSPSYVSFENMEKKIAPLASKKDLEEMRTALEYQICDTRVHIAQVEKKLHDTQMLVKSYIDSRG